MVCNITLKEKIYKNVIKFIDLIYSVIELSSGEYGNSIDTLIKLVEEQNQNDQHIVSEL